MLYYLKLYGVTLAAFLAIDMLWLGWIARPFYQKQLGFLLAPETNRLAALIFYLLFVVGLLVFVVVPGLQADSLRTTLLRAALFGLVTYAAYDLTNHATVKDWPLQVTIVDMLWGTVLSTVVSWIGFTVGSLWR
jgi:uncharacterized membrane protein